MFRARLLCISSLIGGAGGGIWVPAFKHSRALLLLSITMNYSAEHMVQNTSRSRLGPYQLCKYFDMLCVYERSQELQLRGLLCHAYDRWINNTAYPWGGPDSQHFTYLLSWSCISKNIPIHPPPLLSLSSPFFPPPTPLLDFFCFHRNWVLSHAFFSHGSFLPRWIGFWKCITPSKQAEAASPAAYNI